MGKDTERARESQKAEAQGTAWVTAQSGQERGRAAREGAAEEVGREDF